MADLPVSNRAGGTDHEPELAFGSTVSTMFDECGTQAYSLARRLLDGDSHRAEAVVEIVFFQIVLDLCRRGDVANVDISAIVLRSVRQQCIELIQKSEERIAHTSDAQSSTERRATEELTGDWQRVRTPLASLSFDQRTAIEMAYFDGQTSTEIALRTGGTKQDVHRRLRSGLHRLAEGMSLDGQQETSR